MTLVAVACTLTHSSAWAAAGAVAEGETDEDAEDSGSHAELAAASADGLPQTPFARPKARNPAVMRQAAAIRERAGLMILADICPGYRRSPH